ncbi:MAG: ATP-binding cassette domain-containing protein [Candidatus Cloacimonadaceae bacterium]|nr:ATP-binding cassette domain-containing protein [Candidatus Cloacimonadaceae bacterium]
MIEVSGLSLSFGEAKVLQDINFLLETGSNLIILGRSGSSKTVLIKTLMGMNIPESGKVIIDGIDIFTRPIHQHNFAMVFQNAALLDSFTVFQNVALPLYERGEKDFDAVFNKVKSSLEIVGLPDVLDKYPAELSGGMRKRVGIARALVYDPDYIIFDEPLSGLDPITAKEVLYYITMIIESSRATTITITHEIRNLKVIGDRVLFLESGRQLFFGGIDELIQNNDELLRQFMNS